MKKILSIAVLLAFSGAALAQLGESPVQLSPKQSKAKSMKMVHSAGMGDRDGATPVDDSTRLVEFNYDQKLVYNILAQDGLMTHIELAPNEKVMGFYLSDPSRWKHLVSADKSRVFIKPNASGLFNAATLVTSARVYELTFNSVRSGEPWYQRVRWLVNQFDTATAEGGRTSFEGVSEYARRAPAPSVRMPVSNDFGAAELGSTDASRERVPTFKVRPDSLNFGYDIVGKASFRPLSVFDDGKFTWVQMSESPTMPAMFLITEKGDMELVNYTVNGNYMMVSQMVPGLLLRVGDDEVRIVKKKECDFFWCKK